jgi:hypothetical protein
MGRNVPEILKKALYNYIDKPEEEMVDNMLKSCFPVKNRYNDSKKTNSTLTNQIGGDKHGKNSNY